MTCQSINEITKMKNNICYNLILSLKASSIKIPKNIIILISTYIITNELLDYMSNNIPINYINDNNIDILKKYPFRIKMNILKLNFDNIDENSCSYRNINIMTIFDDDDYMYLLDKNPIITYNIIKFFDNCDGRDGQHQFINLMKQDKICDFLKTLFLIYGITYWAVRNGINEISFKVPNFYFFERVLYIYTSNSKSNSIGNFFNFLKTKFNLPEEEIDEYRKILLCVCYNKNIPYTDNEYSEAFYLNQINNCCTIINNFPYF